MQRFGKPIIFFSILFLSFFRMEGQEPIVQSQDSLLIQKNSTIVYGDTSIVIRKDSFIVYPDSLIIKIRDGQFIRWFNQYLTIERPIEQEPTKEIKNEGEAWYNGKIIQDIYIKKLDVFGTSIVDTNWINDSGLVQFGNKVHIKTRDFIIRNNLLFKKGDKASAFVLNESERILRSRSHIKDARIYFIPNKKDPSKVDVLVLEKDIWSLGLGLKFPDIDAFNLVLREQNLLGLGHELQNTFFFELNEKPEYELIYRVPSFLKSFTTAQLIYSNQVDNEFVDISLDKKFVTAETKFGGGLQYRRFKGIDDNYKHQDIYKQNIRYQSMNGWLGWSFLLDKAKEADRRNLVLSTSIDNRQYFNSPEISLDSNIQYQDHFLVLGSLTFSKRDYFKSNYIFGYGKTEDVPLGKRLEFTVGYDIGELIDRPYFGFSFAHSFRFEKLGYISNEYSFGSFFRNGKTDQSAVHIKSLYFTKLLSRRKRFKQRFFSQLNGTFGSNRRANEIVDIRNFNGIRGLRSHQLRGTSKLYLNTTYAVFTPWKLIGFRFAFAGNLDLGYISEKRNELFDEQLYWGTGITVEANNENLIFGILQLRISYFPNTPDDVGNFGISAGVRRSITFRDFAARTPMVSPFEDFIVEQ